MAELRSLTFGELLRRHRQAAGLTQEALAERSRMSARGISDLERGVRRAPFKNTVVMLAEALQLSPQERVAFEAAAYRPSTPILSEPSALAAFDPNSVAPLVGRTRELIRLGHHLADAGPPLLLLAGEPGIGKTRLLQETAARGRSTGWSVLEGGCHRRSGQEPYAPMLGVLETYLRRLPHTRRRAVLEGCAWLVRLLPELAEQDVVPLLRWELPPEQERRLMFAAVGRFLANVAGQAGTLLAVDDLQWAGIDALDVLAHLVRSEWERPLRVIGSYRSTEVQPSDPLATLLADLAREGLAAHVELPPLADQEATELVERLLGGIPLQGVANDAPALVERVVRRASGIPYFLVSSAHWLWASAREQRTLVKPSAEAVPWDVAQSIRQRVAVLPAGAQELLEVAAVVGRLVPGGLLAAVSERSEADILTGLDSVSHAGLLVEERADTYCFAHDLVREVVEAGLSSRRRVVLHRRVAQALEHGPGEPPIAQLAYHYARSDEPEKAIYYLEHAGDRARTLYAHAEASVYFQELVAWLEQLGRTHEAAHARELLGQMLDRAAHYDQALDVLDQAAETYRLVGDLEGLARVIAHIGWMRADQGSPSEGITPIQQLLETQGASLPASEQAVLYAAMARLHYVCDQYTEQQIAAETAAALARSVNASRILVQAELQRGLALLNLGRVAAAQQALEAVIPLAEATDDLWALCFTLRGASVVHTARGAFEEANRYIERALECAGLIGDPAVAAGLLQQRGTNAIFLGQWDRARADLEQALRMLAQRGTSFAQLYPLLGVSKLCLYAGDHEAARSNLQRSIALAEQSGNLYGLRAVQLALAEQDMLERRPASACTRLEPLLDRADSEEGDVTRLLPVLAWAYLELGDEERAQAVQTQAWTRASREQIRPVMVDALQVRARLAAWQGRWQEADAAVAEALAMSRAMPYPYAEAKALQIFGQLHQAQGHLDLARARFIEALAILHQLGERLYAEHIERALAEIESGSVDQRR